MTPIEKLTHLVAVWDLVVMAIATITGSLVGWAIKLLREIRSECARIADQLTKVNGRLGRAEQRIEDHERFCDERCERHERDIERVGRAVGGG